MGKKIKAVKLRRPKNRVAAMPRNQVVGRKTKRKGITPLGVGAISLKTWKSNDPFPPRCFKTMTYAASSILTLSTSGSLNFISDEHTFKLNSIFDPYLGTTPAPLNVKAYGYTEMATLYSRYRVNGVLVEVQFFDPSADGLVMGMLFLNPSSSNSLIGESVGQIERRPQGWTSSLANTGSQKLNFRQYYPMNHLFNISKLQFKSDIDSTTAAITGDPASLPLLKIAMADSNGTAGGSTFYCKYTIRLTYFTEFYQRKQYV